VPVRGSLPGVPVVAALTVVASLTLAGCLAAGPGAPGQSASAGAPTPTPVTAPVASLEDAAARAIATDPHFAGATEVQPGSIGLTKWWTGEALDSGAYTIEITLGWGDCPAGCINHHTWTFEVAADGGVTPKGESGDPTPTSQ
jgi:hypothetical protein